ncbi:7TM diverse intracellular signaling domain-containing protein [Fulvivirga ligni]|uniref:7TM diverse intracellular signaling domain-containing protein n=1 Tax=Fulvivirga ligni TaxID=2904246 RepID=UPI001F1B9E49|nr:7TM diverse intracellular signaling domain-containing protein [Fulvivirga ligni]UII22357.1 ATP-binding protein [Fulvivirga ligni]
MKYIFLLLFLSFPFLGSSQDILNIQELEHEININPYFDYYLDESGALGIDEVMKLDTTAWGDVGEKGLRVGTGESTLWLKLTASLLTYDPEQVVIDFFDQSIHKIELYEIRQSGRTSYSITGSNVAPDEKSIAGNHNDFLVTIDILQSTEYYFKITSPNYISISATMEHDAEALSDNTAERTVLGLFYGALTILILYNLLLFFTTRFNFFGYYAIYILFVSLLAGNADGFTSQYAFKLMEWTDGNLNIITTSMTLIVGLLFMDDFLNIPSWSHKTSKFIKWQIIAIVLVIAACFIIYPAAGYVANAFLSFLVMIFMVVIGWMAVKSNVPQAIYFFTAYIFFGFFIFLLNLYALNVLEYSYIIKYSVHIGFFVSTLILSYGLGVRIYDIYQSLIREEKNKQVLVEQKNKELEEKVKERTADIAHKELNLRSILDNSDNSIWLIDKKYRLIDFNTVFAQSWEISFGNIVSRGSNLLELYPINSGMKEVWQKRFDDVLSGQRAVYRDIGDDDAEDQQSHFEIYAYPIEERGRVTGASFFLKDITERVNSENQLVSQNEMLKKVNKELDSFVYSASHDLKAPLASVMGLINLVKYEEEIDRRQAYYDMMSNSISRLNQSIKDIIDFSRNARLEIEYEEVDLDEMINNIFDDLQYIEGADQIIRCVDIQPDLVVKTDPTRIRVILRNLISNAIHYGCLEGDDKRIEINIFRNDHNMIQLSIKDYGPGIDKSFHQRIFDMFYRANESSAGTGLGLYIVKETVDKLEGKIDMESEAGKGSTFIIQIPYID